MRTRALVLLVGLVLTACSDDPDVAFERGAAPPDRPADIVGVITTMTPAAPPAADCAPPDPVASPDEPVSSDDPPPCPDPQSDHLGTLLVEEQPGAGGGDATVVAIGASTVLVRATGGSFAEIAFDELREGLAVEVWYDGPVAESYPAQAGGAALLVRDP